MRIIDIFNDEIRQLEPSEEPEEVYVVGGTASDAVKHGATHALAIRFGQEDIIYGNDTAKDKFPDTIEMCVRVVSTIVIDLDGNILLACGKHNTHLTQNIVVCNSAHSDLNISKYSQKKFMDIDPNYHPECDTTLVTCSKRISGFKSMQVACQISNFVRIVPSLREAIGNPHNHKIILKKNIHEIHVDVHTMYHISLAYSNLHLHIVNMHFTESNKQYDECYNRILRKRIASAEENQEAKKQRIE